MAEDAPVWEALAGTFQQSVRVDDAFAREASAVERVHIQLAADRAVGVTAPAAGEDEREICRRGARKLRRYARLDHAVARNHHAALRVDLRAVERMQHRGDQLARRARIYARVAVESDYILRRREKIAVASHMQRRLAVKQQLRKLQQRAALTLVPAPALAVEFALAREQIEPAAVLRVQRVYLCRGRRDYRLVARRGLRVCCGQIGEHAEHQVRALAAAGKPQPLKLRRRGTRALCVGQQRRHNADAPPFGRHTALRVHSQHPPRGEQPKQDKVDKPLHQLRHRQQQENARRRAAHVECEPQRDEQRQQQIRRDIPAPARRLRFGEEVESGVTPLGAGFFDEPARVYVLLHALAAAQILDTAQVIPARHAVHALEYAVGVCAQRLGGHVGAVKEIFKVEHREQPQRAE